MKPHRTPGHGPLTPTRERGMVWSLRPPLHFHPRRREGREGRRAVSPAASCGGVALWCWLCGLGVRPPAPLVWFCVPSLEQEDHTTSLLEEGGGREGPWAVQGMQSAAPDEVIPSPPLERDRGLSTLDHKSCQSQQFSSMHFLYFPARKIQRREYIESVIEDHQDHATVMLNEIGIG